MTTDEIYIRRCIQLAKQGRCGVSPNPMVGAVIVHHDTIIGEGYHVRCGSAHAEVNAIASVRNPELLKESTLYVSLEPCSHHGKTPPCADLIVSKKIPRVVVGCVDPSAKVAGKGIDKLRQAGCEVRVGVLEDECRALIAAFTTVNLFQRPFVMLKWAQSADGFIDASRDEGHPVKLSTDESLMTMHKRRAEVDAIMVGTRTAALDNPSLSVRYWHGSSPMRLVLDASLELPVTLNLFDGTAPTRVYTFRADYPTLPNVEYVVLDESYSLLSQVMHDLQQIKIQSLMVEGGRQLLQSFIDSGMWDEAWVERSRVRIGSGVEAPTIPTQYFDATHCTFGVPIDHYLNAAENS